VFGKDVLSVEISYSAEPSFGSGQRRGPRDDIASSNLTTTMI
jgi:hypothetical protein